MSYPNRTLCEVFTEMRKCFETRNFAGLLGMIEEAQSMANRMEASLEDKRDIATYREERSEAWDELVAMRKKLKEIKKELPEDD